MSAPFAHGFCPHRALFALERATVRKPFFWISTGGAPQTGVHVAFEAENREMVDAFHAAALEAGGTDNGAPGVREIYHPAYYGAYVLDTDGNNAEAVCHKPE